MIIVEAGVLPRIKQFNMGIAGVAPLPPPVLKTSLCGHPRAISHPVLAQNDFSCHVARLALHSVQPVTIR